VVPPGATDAAVAELVKRLTELMAFAGLPRTLSAGGVEKSALPRLAAEAAKQWTATFNPRPVTAADFVRLYEAAFS